MRITDIDVRETARGTVINATAVWARPRRDPDQIEFLYRDTAVDSVVAPGDALAAAAFMPAMAMVEDVVVDAPVSRGLHDGLRRVADTWLPHMPKWRRAEVSAELVDRSNLAPTSIASCFSCGVDSFFTVLRPRDEPITTLLTLRGFTASKQLLARGDKDFRVVSAAARRLGLPQIVAESNAFSFCSKYIPVHPVFARVFSGSVLAAVALGLGGVIRCCYVAAGHPFGQRIPTGIDPSVELFSSDSVQVVLDGHGIEREDKIRFLAHNDLVLDSLAVCPHARQSDEGLNCGRCDKCQETAFLLFMEGTLDRCRTLGPVTPETLRRTLVMPLRFEAFERLRSLAADPEMRDSIATALRRSRMRQFVRPVGRVLRRVGLR